MRELVADASAYDFIAHWSNDSQYFAFYVGKPPAGNYLAIYDVQTGSLTLSCLPFVINERNSDSGRMTIWSPDSRYLGIWTLGEFFVLERETGAFFELLNPLNNPNSYLAGWIEGAEVDE